MNRRNEIGYLCWRGHFIFTGNEDYGSCLGKKWATVYVEADQPDEEMFYEPHEERDPETGEVWYSSSGISEQDYEENLQEALNHLAEKATFWDRNA